MRLWCDCRKNKESKQEPKPKLKSSGRRLIEQTIYDHYNLKHSSSNKNSVLNKQKISIEHFHKIRKIGEGSYGTVFLVQKKHVFSKKFYAMKVIRKDLIDSKSQEKNIQTEKAILQKISHPFLISLKYVFEDKQFLYLITDYMVNGDLFKLIHSSYNLTENEIRFYLCEIILALEHLHKHNYIYRDLKPENILIDKDGHIKLTDFGLCKYLPDMKNKTERTFSICGTPDFIAPEILKQKGYNRMVDYWSLGILLYEMLCGESPWNNAKFSLEMYKSPIPLYSYFSKEAIDLLKKLLVLSPEKRLGNKGVEEIKGHVFFKGVNWDDVYNKKEISPLFEKLKYNKDNKFEETQASTIKDYVESPFNVNNFTYDAKEE